MPFLFTPFKVVQMHSFRILVDDNMKKVIENYIFKTVSVEDYNRAAKKRKGTQLLTKHWGLYFFYNEQHELLYIGWARGFADRINVHLRGHSNTRSFYKEIHYIKLMHQDVFEKFRKRHKMCLDIEFYLIQKLLPKYNQIKGTQTAYKLTQRQ